MRGRPRLRALLPLSLVVVVALASAGCAAGLSFRDQPAVGYTYGSGQPLRIAVIDETGGADWTNALAVDLSTYAAATPYLSFESDVAGANIVVRVRRYSDAYPPLLDGYVFQPGVGGFTTVYDSDGLACNFPPSPLPEHCSGELAHSEIYLNDAIPAGTDIEARRERLILHELGHAMGLLRHSPALDILSLEARYGWPPAP